MITTGDRGTITAMPVHAAVVALDAPFEASHIWVGGAGTVNVKTAGGETLDFAMAAGTVVPVQCVQVLSAGTTATGLRRVW